jgi:sugar lactone lactonase YvrE
VTVDPATAQISYGTVPPGYMVVNPVPVTLTIGGAGELDSPEVNMFHDAAAPVDQRWADQFTIRLAVPPGVLGTNQVLALTSLGVTDWLGAFLKGDGSAQSCIFQLIGAGANGTNDPPQPNGQPSGDDILLVGQGSGSTIGRIGEGPGVPANVGQFRKLFKHGLPAGSRLYVRAWDAASFAEAVAYGDSGLRQLSGAVSQTNDFGGWVVGTPISETNDVNHDSIPDAYCIRNSIDPRSPIVPLGAGMSYGATLGGSGTAVGSFRLPSRVVIKDAFVFVLDTGNNRIQVFDRLTGAFVSAYGSGGAAQGQFGQPYGLAVDPRPGVNRLVVADTGNQRVQTFLYDTAGLITNELMWGSSGSGTNQFRNPSGVGVSPSGLIYVADTGNGWDNGNSRIQVFNSAGVYQGTLVQYVRTDMPRGVSVATNSVVLVADTGDHRIRLYAPDGTPAGQVGGYGTNDAQFSSPRGVQTGLGGRGYVADTGNHRIQVFSRTGVHLATLGGPGLLPGFFNLPHDVMPTPDSSLMYVADTYNNRVQILDVILDQDGDGMNDLWEETHGLNSGVDDAFGDLDGDGLLNIGEYRLGLDPRLVDSNGDGLDDGSGVGVASNPLPNPLLPNQIVLRESGQESILRWPVVEGGVYTVEMTTNLVAMPWQPIGVVTSSFSGVFTWEDTVSPEGPQRYYRYKGVEP